MTPRHTSSPSPDQSRLRLLVIVLVVIFVVAVVFFRDAGAGPGSGTTLPTAADSTTTAPDEPSETTLPDSSTSTSVPGPALPPLQSVHLELIFGGIHQPVDIGAPVGDDRLFVVQRGGLIALIDADRQLADDPFLDIRDRVLAGGIEQGLLGLAFHPEYATNGRFFVYYTAKNGHRRLTEFSVSSSNPDRGDPSSEIILLDYEQPENASEQRHYGGQVTFDPDGYLWVSSGDGADSRAQGQNPNTPYGTLMRIDVDGTGDYSIPPDNPFVNGGGMDEVWAYGLRNPWRFHIDPVTRILYVGDVGQATKEEINVASIDDDAGVNFGWSDMEGDRCYAVDPCDPDDYTSPLVIYEHPEGASVTGGKVYRGSEIPEIQGLYFYADWVKGWIRSFRLVDGAVTEERDWTDDLGTPPGQVSSFGFDGQGEMYIVTWTGNVFKFTANR